MVIIISSLISLHVQMRQVKLVGIIAWLVLQIKIVTMHAEKMDPALFEMSKCTQLVYKYETAP